MNSSKNAEKDKTKISGNGFIRIGIWSLIGTFLIKAVNLISLPVFSRLLSTSEYGNVTLFMAYVTIFSIILGLDFNASVAKGSIEFKEERNQYLSSSLLSTLLFFLLVTAVCNLIGEAIFGLFQMNRFEFNILFLYSYASFVILYLSADYIFQFQFKRNTALCLAAAMGNFILSIILILTVSNENRYLGRILGASIPTVMIAVVVVIRMIQRGGINLKKKYILYSLKFSVPLIPHNLSGLILSQADKVMISSMVGAAENGIYSLIYNVGWMITVLIEALNNVWMPWFFRKIEDNKIKEIRKKAMIYLSGFTAICMCVMAISPEIVKLMAPSDYWAGNSFVVSIGLSSYVVFLYYFYVNIEYYYKKTYLISIGTVIAAVVNIVLNLYGLKRFGYEFAAVSTLVSYILLLIFHFITVNYILKIKILNNKVIGFFLAVSLLYSYFIQITLDYLLVRICIAVGAGIVTGIPVLKEVADNRKGLR